MAESMLRHTRPFTSPEKRWATVVRKHRSEFTQVREIDLFKASIRLPKGRFFVSVTEQSDFDQIEETIPDCVQTRLDEFLAGPGDRPGVKVYYLKPLCIEVGDDLILTTREDMERAITQVQEEVFAEYRRRALVGRAKAALVGASNRALALPRKVVQHFALRRQRAIEAYHARLEFERRKTAIDAARVHRSLRTDGCTFEEMLALTNPIDRKEVIEHYCAEEELSRAERRQLLLTEAGAVPWFVALSLTAVYLSTFALSTTSSVAMCDPAFVAEMPGSRGVVQKIGHFDEVGGVMHVEI